MKTYLHLYSSNAKTILDGGFYDPTITYDLGLEVGEIFDYYEKYWSSLTPSQKELYSSVGLNDQKFIVREIFEDTVGSVMNYYLWQTDKIS